MKPWMLLAVLPFAFTIGCTSGDDDDSTPADESTPEVSDEIDDELVDEYMRALPSSSLLEAPAPEAGTARVNPEDVGDPAMFPQQAAPVVESINQTVKSLLDTLDMVTDHPPTFYNSETLELVWGPIDNTDSLLENDTVYVYIRDNGAEADFRYTYSFLRGVGNDTATVAAVIWGGSNPDETYEDYGNGVALWDYEANYEWEELYYPEHGDLNRGRFAATYAKGLSEDDSETTVTIVVAAIRDLVPSGAEEGTDPSDLDYLWGSVEKPDAHLDFLDLEYSADIEGTSSDLEEDIGMRMAFYNSGVGRAEVDATEGDLPTQMPDYYLAGTECWDQNIARTYLSFDKEPLDPESGLSSENFGTEGSEDMCAMTSLENIPSLDDVDQMLLDALDDVASNGIGD